MPSHGLVPSLAFSPSFFCGLIYLPCVFYSHIRWLSEQQAEQLFWGVTVWTFPLSLCTHVISCSPFSLSGGGMSHIAHCLPARSQWRLWFSTCMHDSLSFGLPAALLYISMLLLLLAFVWPLVSCLWPSVSKPDLPSAHCPFDYFTSMWKWKEGYSLPIFLVCVCLPFKPLILFTRNSLAHTSLSHTFMVFLHP